MAEWHELNGDDFAKAAADFAAGAIGRAVAERGRAAAALPGGSSPVPALERLARAEIDWSRVTLFPGDDRQVPDDDEKSNFGMIRRIFGGTAARLLKLADAALGRHEAADAAADRLADVAAPLDLVWLGVGGDGHTASIFPGPDYETALASEARVVGVRPDPLPSKAPYERVTLTAHEVAAARILMLSFTGAEKRQVVEQALQQGAGSDFPIGRVLARAQATPHIFWSA